MIRNSQISQQNGSYVTMRSHQSGVPSPQFTAIVSPPVLTSSRASNIQQTQIIQVSPQL